MKPIFVILVEIFEKKLTLIINIQRQIRAKTKNFIFTLEKTTKLRALEKNFVKKKEKSFEKAEKEQGEVSVFKRKQE